AWWTRRKPRPSTSPRGKRSGMTTRFVVSAATASHPTSRRGASRISAARRTAARRPSATPSPRRRPPGVSITRVTHTIRASTSARLWSRRVSFDPERSEEAQGEARDPEDPHGHVQHGQARRKQKVQVEERRKGTEG